MNLSIAGFETTVGNLFHKAAAFAAKVEAVLHTVVKDVDSVAPTAEAVLTAINPGYGVAAKVIVTTMDAVDAAVQAAGTSASGGVTVSLPAELIADFNAAKTAILGAAHHL
jgi:hypothetical protein